MKTFVQVLKFGKSTKGTHFYEAPIPQNAKIRTVYIQKEAFEGAQPPSEITVTVEEVA